MTAITEKQIQAYVNWGGVNVEDNTNFQEATKLKEQKYLDWDPDRRTAPQKIHGLFVSAAKSYIELAEQVEKPQQKALLYAKARKILTENHDYDDVAIGLKENALCGEALACANAARLISDCSEKASWTYKVVTLLAPCPKNFPIPSDPKETLEKYIQAAESWENLGDLFLAHEKKITSIHLFIFLSADRPKYTAATCYESAAFAIRNANFIKQFKEKNYGWSDLDSKRIELIDKAINTLESVGIKAHDLVFNAGFYEMLAGLYQFKLNTYKVGKKEGIDYSDLNPIIFKFRTKSAELCGKILENNRDFDKFYYKRAVNLSEAAGHVKTTGEAAKLMKEAAISASQFRINKGLPPCITSNEGDEERCAFNILVSYQRMSELLLAKGPDHLLLERA